MLAVAGPHLSNMHFGLFGLLFPDACVFQGTTDDTADPFRTVQITSISMACDPAGWEYRFEAVGDAFGGTLTIYDIVDGELDYTEVHPLPIAEWEDSSFVYTLPLDTVATEADVVEGQSTLFPCAQDPDIDWFLEVTDSNGDFGDCALFGSELSLMGQRGCSEWQ